MTGSRLRATHGATPAVPRPRLVCVGNLTIDRTVRDGVTSEPAMGGDAAYAALAARLFVDDVSMVAPAGPDLPPGLLEELVAAGVDIGSLPRRGLPTVRNVIHYAADGTRVWDMQCTEEDFDVMSVYPADLKEHSLAVDGIVLLAMSLRSQLTLTPWLRRHSGAALYLDVQEDYLAGNRDALFEMIGACDVFLPSEVEAVGLAGTPDLHRAAAMFRALGPSTVVITRAEQGVVLLDASGPSVEIAVPAIIPVDSTGAGDAFCGAFAAVHLATGDSLAAVRAGAGAARAAISGQGITGLLAASAHPPSGDPATASTAIG